MKTIIVDDEYLMVQMFEDECENIADIQVIGKFNKPLEALEFAKSNKIDLAFLDIEMPKMNGIELAEKLRAISPEMIIIFVSAYDNYMKDAFTKVNADYYIIKPYRKEDVEAVIDRAKLLAGRLKKKVFIQTFGKFNVFIDDEPLFFSSQRAKELLAILVDRCGGVVSGEEAFNIMWEDKPYDHREAALYRKALQRLRSMLEEAGIEEILLSSSKGNAINVNMCDCDYFDFLEGDAKAMRLFNDEYMSNYSWSENTLAKLSEQRDLYDFG